MGRRCFGMTRIGGQAIGGRSGRSRLGLDLMFELCRAEGCM